MHLDRLCARRADGNAPIYIFKDKLVLKISQFLNCCRSRINRTKQQKLALPISPTLDSYNGHQLIQQTLEFSACLLYVYLQCLYIFLCSSFANTTIH